MNTEQPSGGKPKLEMMKLSEILPSPIQHESLPAQLLHEIGIVYKQVGRFVQPTLEQWELGFMRDANPALELRIWKCIAKASADYQRRYFVGKLVSDDDVKQRVTALTLISMGITDAAELKLPEDVTARFVDCYKRAWHELRHPDRAPPAQTIRTDQGQTTAVRVTKAGREIVYRQRLLWDDV